MESKNENERIANLSNTKIDQDNFTKMATTKHQLTSERTIKDRLPLMPTHSNQRQFKTRAEEKQTKESDRQKNDSVTILTATYTKLRSSLLPVAELFFQQPRYILEEISLPFRRPLRQVILALGPKTEKRQVGVLALS